MSGGFSVGSFIGRWIFAAVLVLGTYNPTEYSYVSWIMAEGTEFGPIVALVGLLLLIGWIIFIRSTFQAMGLLGISLGAAVLGCLVWFMVDRGWLDLNAPHAMGWVILVVLSLLLAIGMSWSHIRRGMTGQVDVEHIKHRN
jgi:hypothetical protein